MEVGASQLPTAKPSRGTQGHPPSPFPGFAYGAVTLYGGAFQLTSATRARGDAGPCNTTSAQALRLGVRFGLLPFRSPLLGESLLVSSPPPTKMFPLGGFPLGTPHKGFPERHGLFARGRRSHSAIPGSKPACGYPRRIAACHGLRRRPSRAIHRAAYVPSVDYGHSLRSSSRAALTVTPGRRRERSRPSSGSPRLRDCIHT